MYTLTTLSYHLVLLATLLSRHFIETCFIRSCPVGGKRTMEEYRPDVRQCMTCAGGRGQCVGPDICCEPTKGCHIGTKDAEECQKENESITPCVVKGVKCKKANGGNCVANGICCNSESCFMDNTCQTPKKVHSTYSPEFVSFLKKVIKSSRLSS